METDTDPVDGKLLAGALDNVGRSMLCNFVVLLAMDDMLISIFLLDPAIWPDLQATAESDCHNDISLALWPYLVLTLKSLLPTLDPRIVTSIEPDTATFFLNIPLTVDFSPEYKNETLPGNAPNVRLNRWERETTDAKRQRIEVAEIQEEASDAVPLCLPRVVKPKSPRLDPSTETLADPLDGILNRVLELI